MDVNTSKFTGHVHDDGTSAVKMLDLYLPPLLVIVGVTCNTLVIVVMRMRYFNNVSTSLYICINAFIDNVSLLLPFPAHWIHVNFPTIMHRDKGHDVLCKIFHFVGWTTSNLGIALTVAMTLERAIAIQFPLHAAKICTRKRAKLVTVALVALICIKDGHYLIKSRIVSESITAYLCEIIPDSDGLRVYVNTVWPALQNVFLVISFSVIISSNVIIIRSVHRTNVMTSSNTTSQMTSQCWGASQARRSARMRQLTIMLMLDSVSIIICTVPIALFDVIRPEFDDEHMGNLLYSVCLYLVYINRCVNFFLYCISGARFRQALLSICRCKTDPRLTSALSINARNMTSQRSESTEEHPNALFSSHL